jgi:hypothetical protein
MADPGTTSAERDRWTTSLDGTRLHQLVIVSQLASRWGCEGHSRTGWTVWCELDTCR